jgi:hypothetical protein
MTEVAETRAFLRCPLLAGRLVATATLAETDIGAGIACGAGGTVAIEHGLGRAPLGWFTVRVLAGGIGTLLEVEPPTPTLLTLTSTGAVTFELWVF